MIFIGVLLDQSEVRKNENEPEALSSPSVNHSILPFEKSLFALSGLHKLDLEKWPTGSQVKRCVDPLLLLWNLFPKKSSIEISFPKILHDDQLNNDVNHENFEIPEILK